MDSLSILMLKLLNPCEQKVLPLIVFPVIAAMMAQFY